MTAMPRVREDKRDALAELIRKIRSLGTDLSPEARGLLQEMLLEFWLRARCTGTAVLDSVGTETALRQLREWLRENELDAESLGGDTEEDEDGYGGMTSCGVD